MRLPRVSSFFWIGLILLAIGAYALHAGPSFMFDPGVPADKHEALYYIIVGVIMVINGMIHAQPYPDEAQVAPVIVAPVDPASSTTTTPSDQANVTPNA